MKNWFKKQKKSPIKEQELRKKMGDSMRKNELKKERKIVKKRIHFWGCVDGPRIGVNSDKKGKKHTFEKSHVFSWVF